jgi:outer membrane protein OmpA-like peptidoglycan-associated protein
MSRSKGTVANKGCPEVSEVMMKLNEYSRTILFDSGKSSFKKKLIQRCLITEILKEYPYSRFLVEGHTDSDGSNEMNQTLSENRAAALKIT